MYVCIHSGSALADALHSPKIGRGKGILCLYLPDTGTRSILPIAALSAYRSVGPSNLMYDLCLYTAPQWIFRSSYKFIYVAKRLPDPWPSSLPFTIICEPMLVKNWSGWRDSNSRPTAPKAVALPGCATPRLLPHSKARNNTPIKNARQLNNCDKFDRQA
jgi:hypothetical protein